MTEGVWAPATALAVGSVLGTRGERGRPHRVGTDAWGGVCWEIGEATRWVGQGGPRWPGQEGALRRPVPQLRFSALSVGI